MKDFKKYYHITATPGEVYTALTNPFTIELWTGEPAVMSVEPGTEFSMWEGSIVGLNLQFEENKLIMQQWYFDGQREDSVVTIKLHADKKGCSAQLTHTNIPDEEYANIVEGWDDTYFGSLIDFFDEN